MIFSNTLAFLCDNNYDDGLEIANPFVCDYLLLKSSTRDVLSTLSCLEIFFMNRLDLDFSEKRSNEKKSICCQFCYSQDEN